MVAVTVLIWVVTTATARKAARKSARKAARKSARKPARKRHVMQQLEIKNDDNQLCLAKSAIVAEPDCATKHSKIGLVDPSEIRKVTVYDDWTNGTVELNGEILNVSEGFITWPAPLERATEFSVLPGLLTKETIDKVLSLLHPSKVKFDTALDTVDAMPTREIYLHDGMLGLFWHLFVTWTIIHALLSHVCVCVYIWTGDRLGGGKEEKGQNKKRRRLRKKLLKVLTPVEEKITAYVRKTWPEVCNRGGGRKCRVCYSLVRRYLPHARRTHNIHRDGQALVTAVVSLSDYGRDFLGGLYVAANNVGRKVIAQRKGDVVLHHYDLLHGVEVDDFSEDEPSERWSWIMWFKDSETCEQKGYEWSRGCAREGDALCQYFQGWRVHLDPSLSQQQHIKAREKWMKLSAEQGFAEAAFKVGRSHFGHNNLTGAVWWLHQAHDWGEADASYQLGHIVLKGLIKPSCRAPGESAREAAEIEALGLFERAAVTGASPFGGAQFAMYNIGIARLFGFAGLERNPAIAARWFLASRIPEGFMAYSLYLNSVGRKEESEKMKAMAKKQGFPRNAGMRDQALFSLHGDWPKGPPLW